MLVEDWLLVPHLRNDNDQILCYNGGTVKTVRVQRLSVCLFIKVGTPQLYLDGCISHSPNPSLVSSLGKNQPAKRVARSSRRNGILPLWAERENQLQSSM
jgi:hypothetical protein